MIHTRPMLLRLMLQSLRRPEVQLELGSFDPMSHAAQCQYEWKHGVLHAKLTVDLSQEGGVTCVVHELLHAHLDGAMEEFLDPEVAEYALAGIEDGIVRWLSKHPVSWARWRELIGRKLEGSG